MSTIPTSRYSARGTPVCMGSRSSHTMHSISLCILSTTGSPVAFWQKKLINHSTQFLKRADWILISPLEVPLQVFYQLVSVLVNQSCTFKFVFVKVLLKKIWSPTIVPSQASVTFLELLNVWFLAQFQPHILFSPNCIPQLVGCRAQRSVETIICSLNNVYHSWRRNKQPSSVLLRVQLSTSSRAACSSPGLTQARFGRSSILANFLSVTVSYRSSCFRPSSQLSKICRLTQFRLVLYPVIV